MIVNKYNNGGGSGSGSTVSWRQDLSAGTQIARITINGTPQNVYAPEGGSVDLSGYTTTAVTAELSAATSGIAVDLETLSGATAGIEGQLGDFATTAQTSAISADLAVLSAYTETIPTGSTGGGDYLVVSGLPAEANKGQLFYIPAHSGQIVYDGWVFDAASVSEGYVVKLYKNGDEAFPVYRSGSDFHWDFDNDGQLHNVDKSGYNIYYQTDNENGRISIWVTDKSNWTLEISEGVSTADTQTQQIKSVDYPEITYRSNGGSAFTEVGDYIIIDYNAESGTSAQRLSIYNYIKSCTDKQLKYVILRITGVKNESVDYNGVRVYYCHYLRPEIGRFEFYGYSDAYDGGGCSRNPSSLIVTVENNSTFNFELGKIQLSFLGKITDTHSISFIGEGPLWPRYASRIARQDSDTPGITLMAKYGNIIFYPFLKSIGNNKVAIYVDSVVDNIRYQGKWVLDYTNSANAEYWYENHETYQIVSALTEVGLNAITLKNSYLNVPTTYISGLSTETDILIDGVDPYDASNNPFKLTMDGTNIYLYSGEAWNTGGTYTFYASGACEAGVTISGSDYIGLGVDEITESNGILKIHIRGDWGYISSEYFYIAEDIAYNEGQLAYNKTNHKLCLYNGTAWVEVQTTALS